MDLLKYYNIADDLSADNPLRYKVIGCCMNVSKALGDQLLEHVYQKALCCELQNAGLNFEAEKSFDIHYRDTIIKDAIRADIVVENQLIVELKATNEIKPEHRRQLRTYLQLTGLPYGLLVNFGRLILKNGGISCMDRY